MILFLFIIGAIAALLAVVFAVTGSDSGTYSFAGIAIACIAGLVVLA